MSRAEARNRLSEAFDAVTHYDIDYWAQDFLDSVKQYEAGHVDEVTSIAEHKANVA